MDVGERAQPEQVAQSPFAPQWRTTTVGVLLTITLIAFEGVAVATALPTAVSELHGLAYYGWPFTAFMVLNVVGMVAAGEWGDRVGARKPLLTGLAFFTVGLVVSGAAQSMTVFVLGRGLQGVGGGMGIVAIYLIVGAGYPGHLRPRVFGVIAAAWVLPSIIGPVAAGTLAEHATWRLVFVGLIPLTLIGIALLLPVVRRLPAPSAPGERDRARLLFAILAGAGISALQFAGTRLAHGVDWIAVTSGLLGIGALVVGLRRLLPRGTALVRPGIPAVVAFRGMFAGAFFAVESFLPLTLSSVHGYSPLAAGLPLLGAALGWSVGSQIQGRLRTVERYRLVRWGFALVAICTAGGLLVAFPAGVAWAVYPLWLVGGVGMGMGMGSVGVLLLDLSPERERGANSAALQISDVTTAAVCIGIGGALVGAAELEVLSLSVAVAIVDVLMAALACAGFLLASRARHRPARG